MLTIHHLAWSQSDRIIWLCEELGLQYELVRYERDPVTKLAPASYKALHSAQTAPVITDNSLVLAESGAIVQYLCTKQNARDLLPAFGDPEYLSFLFWFHFAGASMMPSLVVDLILNSLENPDSDVIQSMKHRGAQAFEQTETRLGEALYFAGAQFTAADIMMIFPLTTMRVFLKRPLSKYPNIARYLQRIGERPAFQKSWAIAEPGALPHLT